MSDGQKNKIYRDVRFFHGALQFVKFRSTSQIVTGTCAGGWMGCPDMPWALVSCSHTAISRAAPIKLYSVILLLVVLILLDVLLIN